MTQPVNQGPVSQEHIPAAPAESHMAIQRPSQGGWLSRIISILSYPFRLLWGLFKKKEPQASPDTQATAPTPLASRNIVSLTLSGGLAPKVPTPPASIKSEVNPEELNQNKAATTLQAAYRGYKARKEVEALKANALEAQEAKKEAAAIKIQAHVRGALARTSYKKKLEDKKRQIAAAQRIQTFYRNYKARKELEAKKRYEAATTIQSAYKGYKARKELATKKSAAKTLQATYRGHRVRTEVKKQHAAAETIQKAYKAHRTHQQKAALKTLESTLNSFYNLEAGSLSKEYETIDKKIWSELRQAVIDNLKLSKDYEQLIFGTLPDKQNLVQKSDRSQDVRVRRDFLAIACLLGRQKSELIQEAFRGLRVENSLLPLWVENVSKILKTDFLNNSFQGDISSLPPGAKKYLEDTLKGQIYGTFEDLNPLTEEQRFAYHMRSLAHGWSYNYPEIGQTYPDVGEVVYYHRAYGVNLFVAVQITVTDTIVNFCNAGTHELGGVSRDANPFSNSSSWRDNINDDQVTGIVQAICSAHAHAVGGRRHDDLVKTPLSFAFHGHSLGGHDAQICALTLMKEAVEGSLKDYHIKHVLVNTQNALKIGCSDNELFKTLAQALLTKGTQITLHHGLVEGDIVQTAGWYLLGNGCEGIKEAFPETFKIEAVLHKSEKAVGLLGTHTVKAMFTYAKELSEEDRKHWMQGYSISNYALGLLSLPLYWAVGTAALYLGTHQGAKSAPLPDDQGPVNPKAYYDPFSGLMMESMIAIEQPPPEEEISD
jgi:hypothetical protein